MVKIDSVCDLDRFRRFMIMSTCQSYIPLDMDEDETIYPERSSEKGTMYVEAEDKETLQQILDQVHQGVECVRNNLQLQKRPNPIEVAALERQSWPTER